MRIIYLLLSPTFGMHQYTADLANRMADAGHDVHLVTTSLAPRAPYSPQVQIHTPIATTSTGFAPEGLSLAALRRVQRTVVEIGRGRAGEGERGGEEERGGVGEGETTARAFPSSPHLPLAPSPHLPLAPSPPPLVHFTGVHLWNPALVRWLMVAGVPVVHSLHDLDPHLGVRFGRLIRLWNRAVLASAGQILVHGQVYRQRLLAQGSAPQRITYTPLLHLFLSYAGFASANGCDVQSEPWALFFGRLERYKGVAQLLAAGARFPSSSQPHRRLVLAGPGSLSALGLDSVPPYVELRNRLIDDAEAIDLFCRCGLVVLPYLDATQSALIASAYYFRKPVVVTSTGALAEYVVEGQTGWIVPPGDVDALASVLAAALADPERLRRMGDAARAWYDRQRTAEWETLLAMYQDVIDRRKGQGS